MAGGCRCGAVRYRVDLASPPVTYCCHCTDCQTVSGASFALQLPVSIDGFEIEGDLAQATIVTPSGANSTHFYCAACLVRIYNINDRRPGFGVVRAGTLDDSAGLVPRAHIYVRSKQPWIALPDGVPAYDEVPPLDQWYRLLAST
nr:GFA family protein [Sphingomonas sp. G-3-2-10]